jgi:hypothetical protein
VWTNDSLAVQRHLSQPSPIQVALGDQTPTQPQHAFGAPHRVQLLVPSRWKLVITQVHVRVCYSRGRPTISGVTELSGLVSMQAPSSTAHNRNTSDGRLFLDEIVASRPLAAHTIAIASPTKMGHLLSHASAAMACASARTVTGSLT